MAQTKRRMPCQFCNSKDNVCFWDYNGREFSKCLTPDCQYNNQWKKKGSTAINNFNSSSTIEQEQILDFITAGTYQDIPERGISKDICQLFNYQIYEVGDFKLHIENFYEEDVLIAQHNRIPPKNKREKKKFEWRGDSKVPFFGSHIAPKKKQTLWITEGALDAMSIAEVLTNNDPGWIEYSSVCSINGGAGKQTKEEFERNLDYINEFEQVIILFDNDKPGLMIRDQLIKMLPAGKAWLCNLKYKDCNEYLQKGQIEELRQDLEKVYRYRPESLKIPTKEQLLKEEKPAFNLKYPILNQTIGGLRRGRIYTLLAGSGIGKSSLTKELVTGILADYDDINVGVAYLEEPLKDSGLSFIAMDNEVPFHEMEVNNKFLEEYKFDSTYNKWFEAKRLWFVDAPFMALDGDELSYNLEYLVRVDNCSVIILDHITMLTYDGDGGSERKDIDILMKKIKALAKDLNCVIIIVCHLKRPGFGLDWAEGRKPRSTDARGSASIEQLSDVIIGASRNTLSEVDKNKLEIEVLKNRVKGKTGQTDSLYFNEKTNRLVTLDKVFNK